VGDCIKPITDVIGRHDARIWPIDGYRDSAVAMPRTVTDAVPTGFVKQIRSEICPSSVARSDSLARSEVTSAIKDATNYSFLEPFR